MSMGVALLIGFGGAVVLWILWILWILFLSYTS